MKKSRFTKKLVVGILKHVNAGANVEDVCREHGISSAIYCNYTSAYRGMDAFKLQRMKNLEEENDRLRRMYTEERRPRFVAPPSQTYRRRNRSKNFTQLT